MAGFGPRAEGSGGGAIKCASENAEVRSAVPPAIRGALSAPRARSPPLQKSVTSEFCHIPATCLMISVWLTSPQFSGPRELNGLKGTEQGFLARES